MTWRDRLQPASFRSVPFQVEALSTEAGRRLAIHEFAGRSLPYAEDLGRRAMSFKFEAHVLGEDYDIERNALLKAMQEPGPGVLVHPSFGRLTVACLRCELIEDSANLRMARFSLEFSEVGQKRYPDSSPDELAFLDLSADKALAAAAKHFTDTFNASGVEQFVKDDAVSIFRQAADRIAKVVSTITMASEDSARSAATIDRFKRDTFNVISSPGVAAQRFLSVLQVLNASGSYKRLTSGLKGFYSFGLGRANPARRSSRSSRRIQENRSALDSFIKKTTLAQSAKAGARASLPAGQDIAASDGFGSVREAVEYKREILQQIDLSLLDAGDDDVYLSMLDLRNQLAQSVPGANSRLQVVRTLKVPRQVSSLVLAHNLYGQAEREEDIALRNRLTHPAFIPSGQELEVTVA